MFPKAALLVSALIATTSFAAPSSLPGTGSIRQITHQGVTKVINTQDLSELVASDYQRASAAKSGSLAGSLAVAASSKRAVGSAHATNKAIYYTTAVQVGSPSTNFQLIIDTGSANTWVGSGSTKYSKTGTSVSTGAHVQVNYQSSKMQGSLYYDKVALSSTISVSSQAIGVATNSTGFEGVDGVLGIGPSILSKGTTSQGATVQYPTLTDNLWSKGIMSADVVSLAFAPTNAINTINGEITFGGVDSTAYTGALTYTPITKSWPASSYWGLDVSSVGYGSTKLFTAAATPAIVESGLTLLYLSSDAFAKYKAATGAVMDAKTGLLSLSTARLAALKPLVFTIAGKTYSFDANAQLWPRSLNTAIGGASYNNYLVLADLGTKSGSGLDVIFGQAFMERFYFSLDSSLKRIGMANTKYTNSTIN